MADVRVVPLQRENEARLRDFLSSQEASTFFYTPQWGGVLTETYGHEVDYWLAMRGDGVVGAFPVVAVRLPLMGVKHVAGAYQFHSGAPLTSSDSAATALVEHAAAEARQAGAHYLEIRHYAELPWLEELGFRELDSQLETAWVRLGSLGLESLREGHRKDIRRARRAGVTVRGSRDPAELRSFVAMLLRERRSMGSPHAGVRFHDSLMRNGGAALRFYLAELEGQVVGGLLTLEEGATSFARSMATRPSPLRSRVGKALIWHAMLAAEEEGRSWFNLGVSWTGDRGLVAFKKGFRARSVAARQHVLPIRSIPSGSGEYFSGFGFAKRVWRRLPMPLVHRLGDVVTRWVC